MPTGDLVLAMFGSGGDGVVTMGEMMAQAGAKDGLDVMRVEAYGPQIRGSESSCTVRLSNQPIYTQGDEVEVVVVFNWQDFLRFQGELVVAQDAVILYEESDTTPLEDLGLSLSEKARWIPVPFIALAKEAAGTTLAKNIVTLGILSEAFGVPQALIEKAIVHKFSKKKAAVQIGRASCRERV